MSIIKQLDESTINKIAAGEVIERPAGVVKELIENAADANASAITVEIKDGGISMIRITDNGCGIEEDDLDNAFLRHSTSKISSIEDLSHVKSLGFRGEALSSIAAVSQVELITKTPKNLLGSRYIIEGGVKKSLESVGAPTGTTFIIRNLFYNTPVRRKFLKTAQTETSYIKDIVEKMAIAHPDISFKLIVNGQLKLSTSSNGNIKDIIYSIFGRDITNNLLEINNVNNAIEYNDESLVMEVKGFIGKSIISRGNRAMENFFINGRYIKSSLISKAVEEAYAPYMMGGRYPFCVINLNISPKLIDVNIHPTKMEIKFLNTKEVYSFVYNAVKEALTSKPAIVEITLNNNKEDTLPTTNQKNNSIEDVNSIKTDTLYNKKPSIKPAEPYEYNRINSERISQIMAIKETSQYNAKPEISTPTQSVMQLELFDKNNDDYKRNNYHIVGQLFLTYWIVEYDNKMYIIDQHAAHEKVLYEKLIKQIKSEDTSSQLLNPPIIVTITGEYENTLLENMDLFNKLGFSIEHFGGTEYNLNAIPANLPKISKSDFLLDILDMLHSGKGNQGDVLLEKIASMSCKAAVKAGNKLSTRECVALIEELMLLDNPFNCPHGRPVIISMTKQELEKKFKRIV